MATDLTLKQKLFVENYIGPAAGNGAEAARAAGYHGSDATLAQIGYENLQRPEISARIDARVADAAASADQILAALTEIALAPLESCVQVRTNGRGDVVDAKIALADKIRALELLGKHRRLWLDRSEVAIVAKALIGVDLDRM